MHYSGGYKKKLTTKSITYRPINTTTIDLTCFVDASYSFTIYIIQFPGKDFPFEVHSLTYLVGMENFFSFNGKMPMLCKCSSIKSEEMYVLDFGNTQLCWLSQLY